MFWDKAYTPSPNIEALLQKEDVKVEELLDDEDILQECKTQKRNLVQYLTRPDVIKRLIELTIIEPPEDLPMAQRFKYANMACEVLTFGLPSLDEKLVSDPNILQTLYSFLEQEPPLNPLLSSFFSKTFNMLISKKSEQDWFSYQKMCLQVLEFIKSRGNFLDLMFKHFATPVIMDLLLQIIKEVQGGALKQNLYEWLAEQQLVERLIYLLGQPDESEKHNNIAEFISEVIRNGRSMRQKEQDNDSFEPAFIGSDPLLQVIEEEKTISLLLDVILNENATKNDSSIVAGINIVLTLVDESIVDEPASDTALQLIIDKEKENHEKIVSTVIRVIAPRLKQFHDILLNPPNKFLCYHSTPPFGLTRLQVCRLFTVLLRTGNKDIIKEICETDFFNTLLKLFKQYSWNNFLHSEVEKCLDYVFATFDQNDNEQDFGLRKPSALQIFVIVNCKIISKLIDSWMHNKDVQSSKIGRRLGYMGHLIKIFKHITACITNSKDHIGALIESNLNDEELNNWKLITNNNDNENGIIGELYKELELQNKMLANCNAYETSECNASLPKELNNENLCQEIFNLRGCGGAGGDQNSSLDKLLGLAGNTVIDCFLSASAADELALSMERDFKVWEGSLYNNDTEPLNITINPWGNDPFTTDNSIMQNSSNNSGNNVITTEEEGWADFSNNFADFDSHFNSFVSDLGEGFNRLMTTPTTTVTSNIPGGETNTITTTKIGTAMENVNENLTSYNNPSQSYNTDILNAFNCNNNDFGKSGFDDDNDDGFDINFKNAKNLSVKNSVDDINNDNINYNKNDFIDDGDNKSDEENENDEIKEVKTDINLENLNNDLTNKISNNDDYNDDNDMKVCQNSENSNINVYQEAVLLPEIKNDTQLKINSETKAENCTIIKKDNDNEYDENKKLQEKQEQPKQRQEDGDKMIVSNGPVEDGINNDCLINKTQMSENRNEESIEAQQTIKKIENIDINKIENNNEENKQSSVDLKLKSEEICASGDNNSSGSSNLISNNDDLPINKLSNIEIETAVTADTATTPTTTNNSVITVNDIPPDDTMQENGPV